MRTPYLLGLIPFFSLIACQQAPLSSDPATLQQGKELLVQNCSACHTLHQDGIGPKLAGITENASPEWLTSFIQNPQNLIESGDARAVATAAQYGNSMPAFAHLSKAQLLAILSYLHNEQPQTVIETTQPLGEPIFRPQPDSLTDSGLEIEIESWTQLPATHEKHPKARITLFREVPGRGYYVVDLRGQLYHLTESGEHSLYFDLAAAAPDLAIEPGLATGFGSFAFHPDFKKNGLLYTIHSEKVGTVTVVPDFAYADSLPVLLQWVLSEWKTPTPDAPVFHGERRELLRVNFMTGLHGMQEIAFRSTAQKGDPDRNYLYVSMGEGAAVRDGFPEVCGKKTDIWGTLIRIDPAGNNSKNGQYGIPPDNPFVDATDPDVVQEIWTYGFRNPHRFCWDQVSGQLLITDIGQDQIEEINIGEAGANYGWPYREGPYLIDPIVDLPNVYPLPQGDSALGIKYPFAFYDHHAGDAIAGGIVYRGSQFPLLQGQYLMGDIPSGKVFLFDYDAQRAGKRAPIQSVSIRYKGEPFLFRSFFEKKRVEFRLGFDLRGNIFLLTKADGTIWRIKAVNQIKTPI